MIRKPNFCNDEVLKLLQGVAANRSMLLSKPSSEVTNRKKNTVGQLITTTVSSCDIVQRTLDEVREKWGGLKKKVCQ